MKVLAVDTSSIVAAVAVVEGEKLLGEYILNHKRMHSQKLMPLIIELMHSLELKPQDIDAYAASTGPGSFTGLRIGITTIKALAYAAGKPVISVPTLDALAFNVYFHAGAIICPMMDARNNQVYTALYRREGGRLARLTEYMGIKVDKLLEIVRNTNHDVIFLGDAVEIHKAFLKGELKERCEFAPGNLLLQRASSVAYVARTLAAEGKVESCFEMTPFYLRKSQAEREYEKREGKHA